MTTDLQARQGQIRLCRLEGCGNELDGDDPTRGRWANMCRYCRRGETTMGITYRERLGLNGVAQQQIVRTGTAAAGAGPTPVADSLAEKAKAIVPLARRLEQKVGVSKSARREAAAAVEEFSKALTGLRDAAAALIQ